MELLARRAAVLAALLAAACYSPQLDECTIQCGTGGSCPSGTTCLADNFCHGSQTTLCGVSFDAPATPDSPPGTPDAKRVDAPTTPDSPIGRIDAPVIPDAPLPPDAPTLPDAPTSCTPILEPIDGIGVPVFGDISLGSTGILHATYVRANSGELWYAEKVPGNDWALEMVDDATSFKKSQFLDPLGNLHVAYTNVNNGTTILRYAHRAALTGIWTSETVTSDGTPIDASIVVDALGTVHIAYYDRHAGELVHASRSLIAASWSFETIDNDGDVGEYPSLVINPANQRLVVSYHDVANDELKLAQRISAKWMPNIIDDTAGVGAWTSMGIDSQGNIHVAYSNETAGTLRYIEIDHAGGTPLKLPADDTKTGRWNALGLDALGNVFISTYAFGDGDLHLDYRLGTGGAFIHVPVDTDGNVGRFTGIAVDAQGGSHIVYNDDDNATIKHAFVCPPPLVATP